MSGTIETIDDEVTSNPFGSVPEKTPPQATHEQYGDQIPHEMLEKLAPNSEGDYILDKVNNMSEEEALAVIEESVKFHADDWNLGTGMRERMKWLLQGRNCMATSMTVT
jgi:hypothetical protein